MKKEIEKRTELVSVLTIRREWVERVLTVFSLLVLVYAYFEILVYAYFEIRHEIAKPSTALMTRVNLIFSNVATFMTFAFGVLVIITHGVDRIMFRYAAYIQKLEKVRAESRVEGEAKERQLWIDWYNRLLKAKAKGEDFNEPPPAQPKQPTE